jgi:two-component system chemotaxis response regulator CheY
MGVGICQESFAGTSLIARQVRKQSDNECNVCKMESELLTQEALRSKECKARVFSGLHGRITKENKLKVLIADDSGVMRKVIMRSLHAVGVEHCCEARDGQEAFDFFLSDDFDLVITDWNMPEKSGLELVTELRATGTKVPILMITTESQKKQIVTAIQAGVTDYLTKPFENDVLIAKLEKYVEV